MQAHALMLTFKSFRISQKLIPATQLKFSLSFLLQEIYLSVISGCNLLTTSEDVEKGRNKQSGSLRFAHRSEYTRSPGPTHYRCQLFKFHLNTTVRSRVMDHLPNKKPPYRPKALPPPRFTVKLITQWGFRDTAYLPNKNERRSIASGSSYK